MRAAGGRAGHMFARWRGVAAGVRACVQGTIKRGEGAIRRAGVGCRASQNGCRVQKRGAIMAGTLINSKAAALGGRALSECKQCWLRWRTLPRPAARAPHQS